ncbi:Hypothetical predicted protein [Marmota monax]|uniref:Uncharacterized protein n=1 Tax=Marmota monax TaxID=9995 RepID=A0A5E4BTL9_MARMO|nr:Hypothetical predicted protein [Marmota monax]
MVFAHSPTRPPVPKAPLPYSQCPCSARVGMQLLYRVGWGATIGRTLCRCVTGSYSLPRSFESTLADPVCRACGCGGRLHLGVDSLAVVTHVCGLEDNPPVLVHILTTERRVRYAHTQLLRLTMRDGP